MNANVIRRVHAFRANETALERDDAIALEEPLQIRIDGAPFITLMRTPGSDAELACGLLYSEGIIQSARAVRSARHCLDVAPEERGNVLAVELEQGLAVAAAQRRELLSSTSCGVCGRRSIDDLLEAMRQIRLEPPSLSRSLLLRLPGLLREKQSGFAESGGLHAAALFDASGRLLVLREDVGRHNAVDKIVGSMLRNDLLPANGAILLVSGRCSFEIVQKAVRSGIPVVASVSAPTSLAVDLASRSGLLLLGFVRADGFNLYAGVPERIV